MHVMRKEPECSGGTAMRLLILTCALIGLASVSNAQEQRTEITTASNPADDSRPNNDSIPDAYALNGQFDRIVIVRLKYRTDLLEGLERSIKREKIRNAVIISAIGSVTNYHYHTVSNSSFPSKNVFVKNPASPADLVTMSGYVIDGRVHAHASFSNPDKAFGGHLEKGTNVFTFAIVTIGVLNDGIDLGRVDDKTYR
jgi:predicted DNA-binding protein with PD1-like motif